MDGSGSGIIVNYDELIEYQKFRDFLPTKNGIDIFRLTGKDNIGGYMRILINASPERLTQITYYDGAGNQMYPPTTIEFSKIVEYILGTSNEHDIAEIDIQGPQVYTKKILEQLQTNFKTIKNIKLI